MSATTSLREIVAQRRTIVCVGTGGVGKTTTAAVLALAAARSGRRAIVVTVDPARRLAHALGLDEIGDEVHLIDPEIWDPEGRRVPGGDLHAVMLDAKSTFDQLVVKHAQEPGQAERILANTFYRNISSALSGTQEYMAMEKLYELHEEGDFDVVVVDTPPSRNALDLLDAPNRLTKFLEGRVFRMLSAPARGGMRLVGRATRAFLRTVGKVVGSEVLEDTVEFFTAFEGMWEGFRQRAAHVRDLLADSSTSFVLVASPRREALEEAEFFARELLVLGYPVAGAVVNRLHPTFVDSLAEATRMRADTFRDRATAGETGAVTTLADLYENLASFQEVAQKERHHLARLERLVEPGPVEKVPFLGDDVHDFSTLRLLEDNLFGQDGRPDMET